MALVLNEDQRLLQESAAGFIAEKAPVSQLRALRDNEDETGYDKAVWKEMAEMGFTAMIVPEDYGGVGFGYVGAGIVAEEMGRTLAASPFFASCVVAAELITSAGTDDQKNDLLPAIASGESIVTAAIDEGGSFAPENCRCKAEKTADGYVLSGYKSFVPEGHVADKIIVLARTSGDAGDTEGLSLFVVERTASNLIVDRTSMSDSRNWAKLTLENVMVSADALVGAEGEALKALSPALDKACVVLSAEMLGIAKQCFEVTVEYLKERKQFGVLIGSFQSLQHRAAIMFNEIELLKSQVLKALQMADEGHSSLPIVASIAKAKACEVVELATNEAIQMHGGVGMTDEFDIGFYMKRARIIQHLYGNYNYHADRFASLMGY